MIHAHMVVGILMSTRGMENPNPAVVKLQWIDGSLHKSRYPNSQNHGFAVHLGSRRILFINSMTFLLPPT